MDFELSEDQAALKEAARALLDDLARPRDAGGFDRDLWKAMVTQGWLELGVPAEEGGLGSVEVAVLLEEVGRHVAPVPYLQTVLCMAGLQQAGEATWLERLGSGEAIGCVAWRLEAPVIAAPHADVAVVVDDGALWLVEMEDRPPPERAMDLTRSLGWLRPDLDRARRIGGEHDVQALLDRGATGHAVEMLGSADRVLEMAVAYAKEREQFGKPIGSFQAVKHRCADMLVDVEGMRSVAYWAAWVLDGSPEEAAVASSAAKTWCSDASRRVMASGLQVHGGIGFTWEHDLHLYLKRAQLDQVSFGDAAFHRERLARLLRQRVEAGDTVI